MLTESQVSAIYALKDYGLAMGAHCERDHTGVLGVHANCPECHRLVSSTDDLWRRIHGVIVGPIPDGGYECVTIPPLTTP